MIINLPIADRRRARKDTSECILSIHADSESTLDSLVDKAIAAGATLVTSPARQPWEAYAATFTDPDGHVWLVEAGEWATPPD